MIVNIRPFSRMELPRASGLPAKVPLPSLIAEHRHAGRRGSHGLVRREGTAGDGSDPSDIEEIGSHDFGQERNRLARAVQRDGPHLDCSDPIECREIRDDIEIVRVGGPAIEVSVISAAVNRDETVGCFEPCGPTSERR